MADSKLDREVARIQALINSPEMRSMRQRRTAGGHSGIRPRNAATLILVQQDRDGPRVLMGKRHHSLKFMPGALVFPGGAVDRLDGDMPSASELREPVRDRIVANLRGRPSPRAARALGLAAIREMAEETGLLIGEPGKPGLQHPDWADFEQASIAPSLSNLALLARAITPPGPPRRFDTWFFVADAGTVAHMPEGGFRPSGELEELRWIRPEEAIEADTREITRIMLVELMNRLERDPGMDPEHPVPFYRAAHNRFLKTIM